MAVRVFYDPKKNLFRPFHLVCNKCKCTIEVSEFRDIFSRYEHCSDRLGKRFLYVYCPAPCREMVVIPPGVPSGRQFHKFDKYVVENYKVLFG